jgi:sodium pump decarboxylase gamma subunit
MDNVLLEALQISGIGIIALLIALSLLAGLISLMTKYIVDKPEKQEEDDTTEELSAAMESSSDKNDLQLVAAIAVALYRSQLELTSQPSENDGGAMNSWQQFRLNRRLSQSANVRRTR